MENKKKASAQQNKMGVPDAEAKERNEINTTVAPGTTTVTPTTTKYSSC